MNAQARKCIWCKGDLPPFATERRLFCTNRCLNADRAHRESIERLSKVLDLVCKCCGEAFQVKRHHGNPPMFCSDACRHKQKLQRQREYREDLKAGRKHPAPTPAIAEINRMIRTVKFNQGAEDQTACATCEHARMGKCGLWCGIEMAHECKPALLGVERRGHWQPIAEDEAG